MTDQQQGNFVAGGTIETRRFVKMGIADNTVIQATANDDAIGVSRPISRRFDDASAANAGEPVGTFALTGQVIDVECGGNVGVGDRVVSDDDGRAVSAETTGTTAQNVLGIAKQAGASGEVIQVISTKFVDRPAIA